MWERERERVSEWVRERERERKRGREGEREKRGGWGRGGGETHRADEGGIFSSGCSMQFELGVAWC
jgi:hypothetical protein